MPKIKAHEVVNTGKHVPLSYLLGTAHLQNSSDILNSINLDQKDRHTLFYFKYNLFNCYEIMSYVNLYPL